MGEKIVIKGKEIDIDSLSDEQFIKLFSDLKERELVLTEKIAKLEQQIEQSENNE